MKHILFFTLGLSCLLASSASAAPTAVARSEFSVGDTLQSGGTVFFLGSPQAPSGSVAIGTAHSHPRDVVALAGEVRFLLGHSRKPVGRARRFFAAPGQSFRNVGSDLTQDITIFALDAAPQNIRILEADSRTAAEVGERVQILGIPQELAHDEDDYFGTVVLASASQIEIELDTSPPLEGWGGAPILSLRTKRVIGVLQALQQHKKTLRLIATPISSVLAQIKTPLDGGQGRHFSAFVSDTDLAHARENAKPQTTQENSTGLKLEKASNLAESTPPLIRAAPKTKLFIHVETPSHEAIIGDPNGAFLSGRAVASVGELKTFDIAFVIDTSGSTNEASGADINGNGIVGQNRLGALFGRAPTDPGDSVLAAEVAAARAFMKNLDSRTSQIALITFAGEAPNQAGRAPEPAYTLVGLTSDFQKIDAALEEILAEGPDGATWMSAGVDQAVIELGGLQGALSTPSDRSEKIIVFLTDGMPTLPVPGSDYENTRAVFRAADRARRQGIKTIVFAIGPEALKQPVAAVELAKRTDGIFMPVRQPGNLIDVMEEVRLVALREIIVLNQTTQTKASPLTLNADGTWSALLALRNGKNQIRITVLADDGTQAVHEMTLVYVPGAQGPYLSSALIAQRNLLLERRLIELRRATQQAEQEQNSQRRKELMLEVGSERKQAEGKAKQQRENFHLKVKSNDQ